MVKRSRKSLSNKVWAAALYYMRKQRRERIVASNTKSFTDEFTGEFN